MKARRHPVTEMNAGDGASLQIRRVEDQQVAPILIPDVLHREQKAVAFGRCCRARCKDGFAQRIANGHGEGGNSARCEVQLGDGIE